MRNKKLIMALTVLVLAIGLVAGFGYYVMQKDDPKPTPDTDNTAEKADSYLVKDGVNIELNNKANAIEAEANELMESDPLEASKKYSEAAEAYEAAGNKGKAADMSDSADSTAFMTPPPATDPGDAVITPAGGNGAQ